MSVFTSDITATDTAYARDISLPFRFNEECDMLMDEDNEVIDQSIVLITFIHANSLRLQPEIGSEVHLVLFDPLDENTKIVFDTSLRNSIEALEKRVVLDREFIMDQSADELKLIVLVPYRIKVTGDESASRLVINRPGQA